MLHPLTEWSLHFSRGGSAIVDDERRENAFGLLFSLNMLIENQEGGEYTGADCQRWMREVGFTDTHVEPLVGPESMVVGIKGARP